MPSTNDAIKLPTDFAAFLAKQQFTGLSSNQSHYEASPAGKYETMFTDLRSPSHHNNNHLTPGGSLVYNHNHREMTNRTNINSVQEQQKTPSALQSLIDQSGK